ncbi:hypothetical protein [Sinomonas terrae]|uniref:Uncharacterized protein n=1 Tax=Sinomonas terrae TaxID=2908838 RepID=A0ABS9U069_9MICC|nr:hypothetical protein [Sinomonas terrae]MCH6470079.1 hypothetical protein [Sinomonas terrae]
MASDVGAERPLHPSHPEHVTDWTKVRPQEYLEVCRKRDIPIAGGSVDGVTQDGSMIWLLQEYPGGRVIFHKADGITLRRRPKV